MDKDMDNFVTLITEISSGNEAAMVSLYDSTVNRVYAMAMKIVRRPELAEEVVGDVYLQVWREAGRFDVKRATPIAWLFMLCRSRSLDKLRREKTVTIHQYQEARPDDFKDENSVVPLDNMLREEVSNRVLAALLVLNEDQRQTLALAFYHDMSHQQISDYTGQPLGTVKTNIRRAQDVLRNVLKKADIRIGGLYGKA